MKRGWIVGGWIVAMIASVLPALWSAIDLANRNPLGIYADPASGLPTLRVYLQFLKWWLPIAAPISALAAACMFLNRPSD